MTRRLLGIGEVNVSKFVRGGLTKLLRRTLDERDEIEIYERYSRGEIDEKVARVLLGEKVDEMEAERRAFESGMKRDTSSFLAE